MGRIARVEDMPVYQAGYEAALEVERLSREFGPDFRWLRQQALRSSESFCANLTEGFYSQYSTEYLQSLYRCRREARETVTHLCYSCDVGQLSRRPAEKLGAVYDNVLMQLAGLIGSIERKISQRGKG